MAKTTTQNPFETLSAAVTNEQSRKLDYTPVLISTAEARAHELMLATAKKPELHKLANSALDGAAPELINLISAVFDAETIKSDAACLEGADEDQLGRLLESRRSDRSKTKAKGPRSDIRTAQRYIATMYAELMIRDYWQKPYAAPVSQVIDEDALKADQDALNRKIRSLQSKQSRLKRLAAHDAGAQAEFEEVQADIERLKELRISTRVVTKQAVKDLQVDELRSVLSAIDPETLSEEDQASYIELMKKIG